MHIDGISEPILMYYNKTALLSFTETLAVEVPFKSYYYDISLG